MYFLTQRQPTHPGEILKEEFLVPPGISQAALPAALHIPYQRIKEITNVRRGITLSTALRLAKYFGTTPGFWMNLQMSWDLYYAIKKEEKVLSQLQAFKSQAYIFGIQIINELFLYINPERNDPQEGAYPIGHHIQHFEAPAFPHIILGEFKTTSH